MEEFGLRNGIDTNLLTIVAVIGSNAAFKEAIKSNLGVSILPRISIKDDIENGVIKEIKVNGLIMKRKLYMITQKKRTLPNQYGVFLEKLQALHALGR